MTEERQAMPAAATTPGTETEPGTHATPETTPGAGTSPGSGLRNPRAAIRGVGGAVLFLEWIAVLLAIQPIRILAPGTPGWGLAVVVGLAFGCLAVAGLLRYGWGWHVGTALQVAIVATGVLLPAMFVLGGAFLVIWIYVLRVRRTLSRPARFDH